MSEPKHRQFVNFLQEFSIPLLLGGRRGDARGESPAALVRARRPLEALRRPADLRSRRHAALPRQRRVHGVLLRHRGEGDHRIVSARRQPQPDQEGDQPAARDDRRRRRARRRLLRRTLGALPDRGLLRRSCTTWTHFGGAGACRPPPTSPWPGSWRARSSATATRRSTSCCCSPSPTTPSAS